MIDSIDIRIGRYFLWRFAVLTSLVPILLALSVQAAEPAPAPAHGLPLIGVEAEEFLRSAEIVKVRDLDSKGVTRPRQVVLSDGSRTFKAVFKDIDEEAPKKTLADGEVILRFRDDFRHEIAAYELDKLLGLGMVPPCVRRRIHHEVGSLCMWVEGVMTEWERKMERKIDPPDLQDWNNQMHTVRLFLQLIYDIDYKNISNLLVDPDFKIYKIDSSRAFRIDDELRKERSLTRFSRPVVEALRRLNLEDAQAELDEWLTKAQIRGLMARRDLILELVERRIAERGEAAVLYP
jgi:hypothetical protein